MSNGENPLTAEQLKQINEIAKLPAEQQQVELQKFLKTLKPEQVEFLKKQQQGAGQECPFCSIVAGKIPAKVVFENKDVLAILDINPANKGHTLVMPKQHFEFIQDIPNEILSSLMVVIKEVAKAIEAEGLNIVENNGKVAGQLVPHVHFHVTPRFKDDGVIFSYKPKKLSEKEMNEVLEDLKSKIKIEEVEEKAEKKEPEKVYKEEPKIP